LARYHFGNAKKGGECDIFFTGFHPALKTFKSIRAWHDTILAMKKKGEAWYFSHWISSSVKNIQAHSGLELLLEFLPIYNVLVQYNHSLMQAFN
jgi:hypothetical protein